MKLPLSLFTFSLVLVCLVSASAQKRATTGVVIDEMLSVLRTRPSLFAEPVQRMRRGRRVQLLGVAQNDGVRFYKVSASRKFGWVQTEAVVTRSRPEDEVRLARMVTAADGFDQIELATLFLEMYPSSKMRPSMLLLFGDLMEDVAAKLTRDATSRLKPRTIAASGAPLQTYYLNFNMLDRYRKLGVTFLFDAASRSFHYNGASWYELARKYASAPEAAEAKKRLESLRVKMQRPE